MKYPEDRSHISGYYEGCRTVSPTKPHCDSLPADLIDGIKAYDMGDYKAALQGYMPFAEQGNAFAQLAVGLMYANGEGVPQNDKEAVKWYRAWQRIRDLRMPRTTLGLCMPTVRVYRKIIANVMPGRESRLQAGKKLQKRDGMYVPANSHPKP